MTRLQRYSKYMQWAKLHSKARLNLATSGVGAFPLRELPVSIDQLEINGDNSYGFAPLQHAIATKNSVDPACVVEAAGTSMANHLALAVLIDPGDEVLIESPTYELVVSTARYLQAKIIRFPRREESGFAVDPEEIRKSITPKTKLVFLTNLHNPSSVLTGDDTLREVGDIAASVGAHVVVDEVYLDAVYENTPRSSFHLGKNFVVTSSLTKAYGLSGIRCGWILAQPELVQRMWQVFDFTYGSPVHPAELLSVIALDNLGRVRDRARALLEPNRVLVNEFLKGRSDLDCEPSRFGTTVFPRLKTGSAADFVTLLRDRFETSVVPGEFFEQPQHFRIGFCGKTETVRGGLERLGAALDAVDRQSS